MKFFFIVPEIMGIQWKPLSPHVGIGYLVETLQQAGCDTFMVDMRLDKDRQELYRNIGNFAPDYIGVTGSSLGYKSMYDLIADVKDAFDIPVIMGGPHASTLREDVLRSSKTDVVVVGEGEEAVSELARGLPLEEINGLIWRRDGEIIANPPRPYCRDIDSIPFPRYEGFALDKYLEKKIALSTSRGCPHFCTYCCSWLIMGRPFRRRSPENVLEEIEYWYARGYRELGINDDEFNENMKRAERICDLVVERRLEVTFDLRTGIRIDRINTGLLEKMKKAGIFFTAFGIESIDEDVLKKMRKGIRPEQVIDAVKLMREHNFPVGGFFMIGLPGDTPERFNKTLEFARTSGLEEARFYNTYPYPGTELYEWVKHNGTFLYPHEVYLNECDRLLDEPVFETPEFSREERIKAFRKGEFLMTRLYIKKTLGSVLGAPLIILCKIRFIRKLILKMGFRFTKIIRKILKIKQGHKQ